MSTRPPTRKNGPIPHLRPPPFAAPRLPAERGGRPPLIVVSTGELNWGDQSAVAVYSLEMLLILVPPTVKLKMREESNGDPVGVSKRAPPRAEVAPPPLPKPSSSAEEPPADEQEEDGEAFETLAAANLAAGSLAVAAPHFPVGTATAQRRHREPMA